MLTKIFLQFTRNVVWDKLRDKFKTITENSLLKKAMKHKKNWKTENIKNTFNFCFFVVLYFVFGALYALLQHVSTCRWSWLCGEYDNKVVNNFLSQIHSNSNHSYLIPSFIWTHFLFFFLSLFLRFVLSLSAEGISAASKKYTIVWEIKSRNIWRWKKKIESVCGMWWRQKKHFNRAHTKSRSW